MIHRPDDICPRMDEVPRLLTRPAAMPIFPASVYACEGPDQAYQILEHEQTGYVYQRCGHPNADVLAEKVAQLHQAERVAIASSGMAALVVAVLSQLSSGDHLVLSDQLYGETTVLLKHEFARLGIDFTEIGVCDSKATTAAFKSSTRLMVVETITNPRLRVVDIAGLADLCHTHDTKLLVDNTFATPILCRPLSLGADFVMESVSKMMNGHTDVMLGALCGRERDWQRVPDVLRTWGLSSSPWDSWLSARGLTTMHLRVPKAAENALAIAQWLAAEPKVHHVDYPGLASHPDHQLASQQLDGGYGSVVTFHLRGDRPAATAFFSAAKDIPFCPSLGEVFTSLSHPTTTSHRSLSELERKTLGITGGTIRLSLGTESVAFIRQTLATGLAAI